MYTLRIFKDKSRVGARTQISLGEEYAIEGVGEEDKESGIKLRVFSTDSNIVPDEGIAVHYDDYAFIMTDSGKTFETLNRPK